MTTDDMGLDWADPRGAIAADRPHQDEAKAFNQLASLCGEHRCRCLKVGPREHRILQVDRGTHIKGPTPIVSHSWSKSKMVIPILVLCQMTGSLMNDESV